MRKELKIRSKSENLREVEKLVDEISSELSLNDEVYGNLLIATLEAANNAILHGNKGIGENCADLCYKSEIYNPSSGRRRRCWFRL